MQKFICIICINVKITEFLISKHVRIMKCALFEFMQ